MTTNCSLFMKIASSEYLQNILCTQIVLFCFDIQNNFGKQHVLQMLRASEKDLPVLGYVFSKRDFQKGEPSRIQFEPIVENSKFKIRLDHIWMLP